MARKQRIDSNTAAVEVMAKATKAINPPSNVPLTADEMPFFASVIAEFARSEWTEHQLEIAAMLARDMASYSREQEAMRHESGVVHNERKVLVANPRIQATRMYQTSIMGWRRTLSIHGRSKGEARDVAKRRDIAKGIEADNPLDDDLLARPN
jgi:hypothetical protein